MTGRASAGRTAPVRQVGCRDQYHSQRSSVPERRQRSRRPRLASSSTLNRLDAGGAADIAIVPGHHPMNCTSRVERTRPAQRLESPNYGIGKPVFISPFRHRSCSDRSPSLRFAFSLCLRALVCLGAGSDLILPDGLLPVHGFVNRPRLHSRPAWERCGLASDWASRRECRHIGKAREQKWNCHDEASRVTKNNGAKSPPKRESTEQREKHRCNCI